MKRSTLRAAAVASIKKGGGHRKRSRYAAKVARGNQMYGPGCCAHTLVVRNRPRQLDGDEILALAV